LFCIILIPSDPTALLVAKRPPKKMQRGSGVRLLLANLRFELRKPVVTLILITTFLFALAHLGILVWTSRGLAGVLDETLIGILLLGNGITGAIAGSLLGPIIRRFGYKIPISVGLLSLFTSLVVFIIVGDFTISSSIPLILLGLVIDGWAGGLLFPTIITISQVISPKRRGVLAGVVTFAFFLGSAINPTLFEPLFIIGLNWVYIGFLGVSLILLMFFIFLLRKIKSLT